MSEAKQPFRLSKEQRKLDLLICWKRDKEKEKAKAYLDAVEPRIQTWIGLQAISDSWTHAEIRDACNEFNQKLVAVRACLEVEKEKLYALIGISTHSTEEEEAIREAASQFRKSSAILAEASRTTADSIEVSTGPNIGKEVFLVETLAELYRRVFQKEPSVAAGSNFQCFVSKLPAILKSNDDLKAAMGGEALKKFAIGGEALKAGVDGLANYRYVPPEGATWSKADPL